MTLNGVRAIILRYFAEFEFGEIMVFVANYGQQIFSRKML